MRAVGHPLEEWRRARGMSLQELAEKVGVTASMVSQIIHRRKYPSRRLALRIREVTAIPICRLYDMPACAAAAAGRPDGEGGHGCG